MDLRKVCSNCIRAIAALHHWLARSRRRQRGRCPRRHATAFPGGTLVDLSHTYDKTTVFWPTAESFRFDKVADGVTPDGYYYAANNFFTSEHGGTHLDAPVHFAQGAQTVDQIPLDRFFGEAYVVDVVAKADAERRLPGDSGRHPAGRTHAGHDPRRRDRSCCALGSRAAGPTPRAIWARLSAAPTP